MMQNHGHCDPKKCISRLKTQPKYKQVPGGATMRPQAYFRTFFRTFRTFFRAGQVYNTFILTLEVVLR